MCDTQQNSTKSTPNQNEEQKNQTEDEQESQEEAPPAGPAQCTVVKETLVTPPCTKSVEATCDDTKRPMWWEGRGTPKITISEVMNSPGEAQPQPQAHAQRSTCQLYFGIKSYIHDFYHPPDKEVFKSGEYLQEDDFQFLVEPGKRRWRGWWLRVALWLGVNLMLVGIIAMLVGHLTTPRQTVVDQQDTFTVLDRWAVTFNNRLVICQLAGLAGFTSGAVIVMLTLLVSSYQQDHSSSYYIMSATLVPEAFSGNPLKLGRIPLHSSVRGVQPTLTDPYTSSAYVLSR